MKKVFSFLFLIIFLFAAPGFAETISKDSKITEVTVYPGSARVVRELQVDLKQGEHTIVFENIIPRIDQNSLSVSGKGTAEVKIFGATFKEEFLKETSDERVNELEKKIESLRDQISLENQKNSILDEQKQFLKSIQLFSGNQIPKDLVTKMPSIEDLSQVYQFVGDGLIEVETKKEANRIKMRELNEERLALERQLNQLRSGSSKTKRSVAVELSCAKGGTFTLDVAYLLKGAYWRPVYDARAQLDKQQVELATYAMVKQTTGEDWNDVNLTLSTAQPSAGGRMPYVAPWILKPRETREGRTGGFLKRGLQGRLKSAADNIGDVQYEAYYADGNYQAFDSEGLSPAVAKVAETAYAEVGQKGLSVEYKLAKPATLASDGTEQKLPVSTQELKVDYEYATFPKVRPSAFLGSRASNSEKLQLLAGDVNLFLEGDYIGKSSIDNIMPGEEFDLYLGVNENIKVKREMISKEVDKTIFAGIESSSKKVTYQYKLTVENYTKDTAKIKLFESMPVAEDDRIKIKIFDMSLKPTEKDWKDRQGVWLWKFDLKPKEKKEITYSFMIEHSRKLNVDGI